MIRVSSGRMNDAWQGVDQVASEPPRIPEEGSGEPLFVLRGSTRHGVHEVIQILLLLGVVCLFVVVLRTMMENAGVGAVVFAGALAVGLIAALIYASRASKALFLIYGDRAIIDSRPQGAGGRRVEVAFGDLRSVIRDRAWIRMRRKDDRIFAFRGDRLHVEDAFDVLLSSVDEANPDCVTFNRG